MSLLRRARALALHVPRSEGGTLAARQHLERIIAVFREGFHLALEAADDQQLVASLDAGYDDHFLGFAYEGAGAAFAALDLLVPLRLGRRLAAFTGGAGRQHHYIAAVGAGVSVAKLPWGGLVLDRYLRRLDPEITWCVLNGIGFHAGVFRSQVYVDRAADPPASVPREAHQLFDAGLGRSLWWVRGADPEGIELAIDRFPPSRRAELWGGIGLACAYAGGVDEDCVDDLAQRAGPYRSHFLGGIAPAARLRQSGGNPSEHTNAVCRRGLDATVDEAAELVMDCLEAIGGPPPPGSGIADACHVYRRTREILLSRTEGHGADAPAARGVGAAQP